MKNTKILNVKGQALVEAVVAIGVVILIVTGLIVAVLTSLRSAQSSRTRSTATKLTEDGLETVRNLKNAGWNSFISKGSGGSGTTLCFDENKELILYPDSDCENIVEAGVPFTRIVLITNNIDNTQTTVRVDVTWTEGGTPKNSNATTYLTQWR